LSTDGRAPPRLSLLEGSVDAHNFGKGGAELLFGCIPADEDAPPPQPRRRRRWRRRAQALRWGRD